MRWAALSLAAAFLLPLLSGADEVIVEAAARDAAIRGSARVVVELRVPGGTRPEAELPGLDAVARQRAAIAAAQQGVVARLAGTSFRAARVYTVVPLIVLEIGPDALAALERSADLVARVRLDVSRPPARGVGT